MTSPPDRLADYISETEPLSGVYSAEMTGPGDVYREPVVLGVTERRLVSLSDANEFTSIPLDHISSIRSVPTNTVEYRGNDYRILLAASALLAGTGLAAAAALLTGILAMSLFLLAVGGVLVLNYGYQRRPESLIERLATLDYQEVPSVDERHRLLAGGGVLTLLGLSGLLALTPTVSSAFLTLTSLLLLLGSVWLGDYAWRHRSDLDGIELVRASRKNVRIDIYSGDTVSLLVDPTDDLDQMLSRGTYRSEGSAPANRSVDGLVRES